jgi:hypothetical protein
MHESQIRRPRPPLKTSTLVLNVIVSAAALLAYGWLRWPQIQDPTWAVSWTEAVVVTVASMVAVGVLVPSLLTLAVRPFDKARRTIAEAARIPLVELTLIRPSRGALDPLDVALAAFEQPVRAPKWRDAGRTAGGVSFVPHIGWATVGETDGGIQFTPLPDEVRFPLRAIAGTFAETEQEKTEPRLFTHEYTPRHGLALDYTKDRDV